jgi:ATP-dependent helicase/nuclease subunit A
VNPENEASATRPFKLTDEQRAAVDAQGRDVYVTAAAGSGKTAVLTERVYHLIAESGPDGRPPVELERLLVITFTRKAAQEMRERIERRIRAALEVTPDSPVLRAALDGLSRSSIMTIDAFCDRLVRRHFHLAGVSPTVRLADEAEELEVVHTATREVFEASAAGEEGLEPGVFADLLRSTPPSRGGLLESLEVRVDRLRTYVAALEDGAAWMQAARRSLEARRDADSLDALPDLDRLDDAFRDEIAELNEVLEALWAQAMGFAGGAGAIPCAGVWRSAMERLEGLSAPSAEAARAFTGRWRELAGWLADDPAAGVLAKLYLQSNCGVLHKSALKGQLQKFSDEFVKWRETWFSLDEEQMLEAERLAGSQALALLDLAEAVERRAQAIKRRRGLMSFGDIQRAALRLLTEDGGPSAIAREYRDFYEAVLVDEYQDVSPLQDALIRRVARPADPARGVAGNLFIVGDVKQSIYRFRQAEPILFRGRLDEGREPAANTEPVTLSLSTNFRSRPGVLSAVNELFRGLMDRRIGDVDMSGDALLSPGRPDGGTDADPCVELQWLDPSEIDSRESEGPDESDEAGSDAGDADLRGIEAEARWIAGRIRELQRGDRSMWIPDEDAPGGRRPVRPADCAILVRALAASVDTWVAELGRWGLRVRTTGGESLWKSVEGEDLLAALRLVDQPFDDLALATVLRSPLGCFTDDDLLKLRMAAGGPLWSAVWSAAGRADGAGERSNNPAEPDPELAGRLRNFFTHLDRWRELSVTHSAEAVLDAILEDAAYEAHVLGGPRAEPGMRNLDELRARIRARERQGNRGSGLSDFLRALQAEGRESREREDEALRLDPDAVQLMTVHKSKGLEFPVVFLARLAQRYNTDHRSAALHFSHEGSLALAGVDPRRKVRLEPPSLLAFHSRETRALRGEEFRLLYVAMTRARERLILVASAPGLRHHRNEGYSLIELGEPAPAFARVGASSPAAVIGPRLLALARRDAASWLRVHESNRVDLPPPRIELEGLRRALTATEGPVGELWRSAVTEYAERRGALPPAEDRPAISPRLAAPRADRKLTPLKVRPSGFKSGGAPRDGDDKALREEALFEEEEMMPVRWARSPHRARFVLRRGEEDLSPTDRGRLTHAFLQHLDLAGQHGAADLRSQAGRLFEAGLLGVERSESLELIPYDGIAAFFASPLGRRLTARPGSVTRELPFTWWPLPEELKKLGGMPDRADPKRLMTVQGVIDCVVDEGDRVTLIDYKSDAVAGREALLQRVEAYTGQVQTYAEALRAAWNLTALPETWLVFLRDGHTEPMNERFR